MSRIQFHSPPFSGQSSFGPLLSELSGRGDGYKLRDESPVPAGQSKVGPHLLLCTWVWAATDGLNLVHLWSDLASPKPLNQVLFLLFDLLTLVQCQACLLNLSQYSLQMTQVLLPDVAEDDHIIQVGSTSVFTPLQDPVHQSWEGGGCSIDAKGHHSKLKEADRCP